MKKKAKQILKHPLISGSTILLLGSLSGNFFNFLYNLFMSRALSIVDYGILVSIFSLISLPSLLSNSVVPTAINFAGSYMATNEFGKVKGLYLQISKLMFFLGLLCAIIFIVFSGSIASFIHITDNRPLIVLAGVIVFIGFMSFINMAFLQARLSFAFISFSTFLGGILKFILGVALVLLGYSVGGVLFGLVIAGIIMYIITLYSLRNVFHSEVVMVPVNTREIIRYAIPVTLTLIGITSFINLDILLVKHFFSAHDAGLYAGLSLVGKVVFYISAPIGTVMFPLIVQKHSRKENFTNIFKLSVLLVIIPSLLLTGLYAFFPKFFILFFLKNKDYLSVSSLLALFGIFTTLYSLLSILATFYLSIKKTTIYIPIIIGALLQIVLITLFHQTFLQIILISLIIVLLLVIGLLLYYPHAAKKKFTN